MPSPPRFLGVIVITQAISMNNISFFLWHPRLLQEIELECGKKLYLSNRKVFIMAEATSLAEFLLHGIATCKLLLNKIVKQTYVAMHVLLGVLL